MIQLILRAYDLKLKHTFTISRQSFDTKPTLVVELKDGNLSGYGEASANPYYKITIEKMMEDLSKYKDIIENSNDENPEEFWSKMYPYFKNNMFALCALDLAYHDLYARKRNKKLYDLWGYDISRNPLSDYTIGIDTIEKMVAKMEETPWPIYKIKLGTKDDLKIVRELRKHSNAIFRIDANCAWNAEETIQNAIALKNLGVEFLEQPLPAEDWEGSRKVFLNSVLPIIADESCQVETDVAKCYNHFHGINIKLVKCGGLTPAKRMLKQAKEFRMKTMVGSMTESSIAMSAIAHLLPLLDYVDMDGGLLISNDIATGITMDFGKINYSSTFGTGVQIIDENPKIILK